MEPIPAQNAPSGPRPDFSILLPAYNEEACIDTIVKETAGVLRQMNRPFEILVADDGSTDATPDHLRILQGEIPELRVLRLAVNSGQSAALGAAFQAARGELFITLDADGQNDPADIPALAARLDSCDVCCGYREKRQDSWSKRIGSRLANAIRNRALHERIRDTGCTLKAFHAEWARSLPMQFRGMHRFLPALMALSGARIEELPVNHRPRAAGHSKYTNWGRLKETIADLRAVRWMQKRHRPIQAEEKQWKP